MSGIRRRTLASLIGLAATLAAVALAAGRFFPAPEAWFTDVRVALLSSAPAGQDPRVAVIAITEETLAQLPYRSPIDRDFMAQLTTAVDAAGARHRLRHPFRSAQRTGQGWSSYRGAAQRGGSYRSRCRRQDRCAVNGQSSYLADFVAAAGANSGYVDLLADADGSIRRRPDAIDPNRDSLSAAMVRTHGGATPALDGVLSLRRADGVAMPFAVLPAHVVLNIANIQPGGFAAINSGAKKWP